MMINAAYLYAEGAMIIHIQERACFAYSTPGACFRCEPIGLIGSISIVKLQSH